MRRTLALAALAVGLAGPASAQRLPKLAAPVNYRIALVPDLAKGDLTGDETIVVRIANPTKTIVLNSVGLELSKVTISASGAEQPAAVSLDPANETASHSREPSSREMPRSDSRSRASCARTCAAFTSARRIGAPMP